METVGEILRKERLKQKKTLLKIQRETKIPEKTLVCLEDNDFNNLPSSTFVVGFIKIYSQALGLTADKLVAIYRRDYLKAEPKDILPPDIKSSIKNTNFFLTPKVTLIFFISLIVFIALAFIGSQLKQFFSPPLLTIDMPLENQKTDKLTVMVIGKADKEASVYINDQLISINEEGKFSYNLKIFPGQNTIIIKAVDRKNRETTVNRHIIAE